MNFYNIWEKTIEEGINDISFLESFLKKTESSRYDLLHSTEDELFDICNFLNKYSISKMIDVIDSSYLSKIDANMVVQYSSFDAGVYEVVNILSEQKRSLSFDEIGMYLMGERDTGAMKKYGENHAKFAYVFDLVQLSVDRPIHVSLTNFGAFCSLIDEKFKKKILRLLALRDPLVRNIIYRAKQGKCKYLAEVSCLSESTQVRRRSNVKQLLDFILKNTEYEFLLDNIEW